MKMNWLVFLVFLSSSVSAQIIDVCRADTSFTDILFVVDNSQSIDDMEYSEFSNIIMATISNVQQKCESSQIGLIHYGGAFGQETFLQQSFSRIMQIESVDRAFCTDRNQFNNCSEGGGDDLNSAIGTIRSMIEDGTLNRNPVNKLAIVIFTDAFGFEDTCTFINCSVIRPFTNIDLLKSQYGAQVTVVGASSQAEASLLAIYASPGGTFDKVDLFAQDCPSTFDGCTLPRKYIPIEFDSPISATADSIAVCVNCTIEIIGGVTADAGADKILCEEEDVTATISAQLINGTAPFIFNWDQGLGSGSTHQVAPAVTTTYTVTISDANGCVASDGVTITVETCIPPCEGPPIINCPGDTTLCPGSDISTLTLGVAMATSGGPNCPEPIVTMNDSLEIVDDCIQIIYRTWTASYPGNSTNQSAAQCVQEIRIEDIEKPTIIDLPQDITVDSQEDCLAGVIWMEPMATDNCLVQSFVSNIPSGNNFELGTTHVVYTAKDYCGNETRDSFAVHVIQQCCTDNPIIICPPDYQGCPMGTLDPAMTGMATGISPSEFCGTPVITFIDQIEQFGDCDGAIVISRIWTATDPEHPQFVSSCIQKISLIDTFPPRLLSCPPDVTLDPDNPILEREDPGVDENCSFRLTYSVPNGSSFTTGVTKVLVTATDLCGNIDTCDFLVTVPEEVQIICPEELTLRCLDTLEASMIPIPEIISPCALCEQNPDNCVQTTVSIDTIISDGDRTIYHIRYTATDLCGTDNECTSRVVIDNSSFVVCPDDIIVQAPIYGFTNVSWEKPSFETCCTACKPRQIPGYLYMGQFGASYYYCSYARVNWQKAQQSASENGGHLVVINNVQENEFIAQRLIERHAYIGLSDRDIEGNFAWINNDPSSYRKWKPGQPDNSGNEDFVEMDAQGYWYDVSGLEKREFVMEITGCDPVTQIGGPESGSKFRPGTTTITYYAEDGCGNTAECSFNVIVLPPVLNESFLAGSKSSVSKAVSISPNPASSEFMINAKSGISNIEIFQLNGQVIEKQVLNGADSYQVNLDNYKPGLYLIRTLLSDGRIEVQKVVVE